MRCFGLAPVCAPPSSARWPMAALDPSVAAAIARIAFGDPKQTRGEGRVEVMATTRQALDEKYEIGIDRRKQGLDEAGGKATLAEFLKDTFLDFYKTEGGVEPQTWSDYRFHSERHIIPLIGKIALCRLTTLDVDQWMSTVRGQTSERTGRPLSDRTIEYAYAVLRRALQFAVDWRYIAANPASARMRAAKRRRKTRTSVIRFLTADQAKNFLKIISGDRHEALYILALTTGMREGELFGLKWADVDLPGSRLTVNHALACTKRRKGEPGERFVLKGPKTIGSRRTIEIPAVAVATLQEQSRKQAEAKEAAGEDWQDESYVFTSRSGTPLDRGNALHRFQKICKDNALPKIRLYDLRHTHASLLIAEGVHAKKIAERLGHASIKLTNGHLRPSF
jgi:integrase